MDKRGILLDSGWSYLAEGGQLAIRDSDTGNIELLFCENFRLAKALRKAKGKQILCQVNEVGVLVSFRRL